ncbi:MAG: SDR family oxidoreductase [Acidobacteria bacterium]|nr:MAG: SDR family oxidoreductase [Acidobacteriota bacterium]
MNQANIVMLTGCASGIGRRLAEALIARGHVVIATDINLEKLQEQARARRWSERSAGSPDRIWLRRLDVRDGAAWEGVLADVVATFGGIDVLMNVAGYIRPGWVHELDSEDVHRHLDINAKGVILGTQAAARQMVEQRRGHIINFASMAALAPIPGLALYSASKYAVRAFSLAAAEELRPHGVFVTVICPDAVRTPMFERQKEFEEAALTFSAPRVFTVEEISDIVLNRVLRRRPREVFIPRRRGWLARFVDLFPGAASLLVPIFRWRGRTRQARWRDDES